MQAIHRKECTIHRTEFSNEQKARKWLLWRFARIVNRISMPFQFANQTPLMAPCYLWTPRSLERSLKRSSKKSWPLIAKWKDHSGHQLDGCFTMEPIVLCVQHGHSEAGLPKWHVWRMAGVWNFAASPLDIFEILSKDRQQSTDTAS